MFKMFEEQKYLLIVIVASFILISSIILDIEIIRIIFGIPFVLFFPGYALTSLLFPEKEAQNNIEKIALSFVLSIVVVSLFGFILNYTPFGIRLNPLLVSLATFIIGVSLAAFYRSSRISESGAD